jgi:hypothetical protein
MTEEAQPRYQAFYDRMSAGPGTEVLTWRCDHFSAYSAIHSFSPEVPQEAIDAAKGSLLAYYKTVAPCGCAPVITPAAEE